MIEAAWSWIRPHLGPQPPESLDLVDEKHLQEVHPDQPILPQLLKALTQGMQPTEVLLSHSIPPPPAHLGRQGKRATTDKHRERSGSFIP
jgi:hypothetical protein